MSDQQGAGGPTGVDPGSVVPEAVVRPASSAGDPPDDAALLAAHVAGDPDAFGELVRRHRDRLWAVAVRTTGDPEDASDALQDALVSAYRNAGSFRGDAAVTTWLHRIVVNACLDRMRRRKARPTVPLPEEDGETGRRGVADPRDDLDRLELRMEIDLALRALPDDQRSAVVLVDVEGHVGGRGGRAPRHPRGHGEEPVLARTGPPGGRAARGAEPRRVRRRHTRASTARSGARKPDERRRTRTTGGDPMTDRTPDGVADTPGPDATPEQDSDVRALLAFLRDEPMEMPRRWPPGSRPSSRRNGVRRAPPGPPPRRRPTARTRIVAAQLAPVTVLPTASSRRGSSTRTFAIVAGLAAAVVVVVGGVSIVRGMGSSASLTSDGAASSVAGAPAAGQDATRPAAHGQRRDLHPGRAARSGQRPGDRSLRKITVGRLRRGRRPLEPAPALRRAAPVTLGLGVLLARLAPTAAAALADAAVSPEKVQACVEHAHRR